MSLSSSPVHGPSLRGWFHIELKYAKYFVNSTLRRVITKFPDNLDCTGTRDESDPVNIREAESQGYTGPDCVWQSLVEHELLHSLVAEVFFDKPSSVLRTEAGGEFNPSWERYEEEMLCLAIQVLLNTNVMPACLTRFIGSDPASWERASKVREIRHRMTTYRQLLFGKPQARECAKCGAWYHGDNHLCHMPLEIAYTVDQLGIPHVVNGEVTSKRSHDLFVASQAELYQWDDNK